MVLPQLQIAYVFILALILALLFRICWVLHQIRQSRRQCRQSHPSSRRQQQPPLKTLVVLGSGGHTTEMLAMTQHLNPQHYYPILYAKAVTDTTSAMRLRTTKSVVIYDIPRAREVGQSLTSSVAATGVALLSAVPLLVRIRPHLVLVNGPGTCIPICLAAFMIRVCGLCRTEIVFCESYCRVKSLSWTGRLLVYWMPVASVVAVHWPELQKQVSNSVLLTTFGGTASVSAAESSKD